MAAEKYLSRRIPDLRVGNNIDEIDKKLIPASIHPCLLVELGPICNSMTASLFLKSCRDHNLLKSHNGGLWKNNYRSRPCRCVL